MIKFKEIPLVIKALALTLYIEVILALVVTYDEFEPTEDSLWVYLAISLFFAFQFHTNIKKFMYKNKESYKTLKQVSLLVLFISAIFYTFIFENIYESKSFIFFPIFGLINIFWLSRKPIRVWVN